MHPELVHPWIGAVISGELEQAGQLVDYTEMQYADEMPGRGMVFAHRLHGILNHAITGVTGQRKDHLPLYSVRVFPPGEHATTIHRNHPSVGPWAVGITLRGQAPFNVYEQDQLRPYQTIPLRGDGNDPMPFESMTAGPGAGWVLYTAHEQLPHSGGFVNSREQRELLLFYGDQYG